MYSPRINRNENIDELHELIRRYSFAPIFTQANGEMLCTHLPFMVDSERGTNGTLIAHFGRANPHWKVFDGSVDAMVVFVGAHTYISPAWYDDQETVPTWNYAAVHASGRPVAVHDIGALRRMVTDLTSRHETPIGCPWQREQSTAVMEKELKGIVGIEMPIETIQGKFKFSQNKSISDQNGVIAALEGSDDPLAGAVADIMRNNVRNLEN